MTIKEALSNVVVKIINTIFSTKFLGLVLVEGLAAFTAFQDGASITQVLGGIVAALVAFIGYTKYKTSQNIAYLQNGKTTPVANKSSVVAPSAPVIVSEGDSTSTPQNWQVIYQPVSPLAAYPKSVRSSKYASVLARVLPPVPQPSLVKDRVATALEFCESDRGFKDVLTNRFQERYMSALERMLSMHPEFDSIEAIQEAFKEYLGVVLTPKQCANVQSILGLRWAVTSLTDSTIMANKIASWERDPIGTAYQKVNWQKRAKDYTIEGIINEAVDRVRDGKSPVTERRTALAEFGYNEKEVKKTMFAGSGVRFYHIIPGGEGGTFQEWDEGENILFSEPWHSRPWYRG